MPTRRSILAAAGTLAAPPALRAQTAVARIIVPFPPGGGADAVARQLQAPLTEILGQTVMIENRPGASGSLGSGQVARSAPDGLTWLLVFDSHAVNQALIPNLGYDTQRDFQPVMLIGTAPMLANVHRSRSWRSLPAVIESARARPEAITFGTTGSGTLAHLALSLAQQVGGFSLTHVPYRGGGAMATAAVAGEIDLSVATQTIFNAHYASGTLIPVVQTGPARSPRFSEVPTLAESGIPGVDARAFWGVVGPAGLAPAVLTRMETALRQTVQIPGVRDRLTTIGVDLDPLGPEAFGDFLARQMAVWGRVVREKAIRPD
jgi:tripartite-type tricarboxylate transporter receptor subunit TctC